MDRHRRENARDRRRANTAFFIILAAIFVWGLTR